MTLQVAIQMDPVEGINIDTDTTFFLMLEAQTRGHALFVYTPDKISLEEASSAPAGGRLICRRSRATIIAWAATRCATWRKWTWC